MSSTTDKITGYHWILFAICFIVIGFAGVVSGLMSVYLPVVVNSLMGSKDALQLNYISAYINAVFIFGWAFGGFIWGYISDKAGRKKATVYSIICYGLFTVLTGTMPTWWGVVLCRFITGFGMGGIMVATTTIMIEEWPAKSRAVYIGMASVSMPIGIFSAGAINFFVSSWRQGFGVGVIPLAVGIISIWLLKESESWLTERDRVSNNNLKQVSIFASHHRKELMVGAMVFGAMLIGLWAIFSWLPTWVQSIAGEADAQEKRSLTMMIFGIGGLTGSFISGWVMNAIGSRRALILCYTFCALAAFLLFKTNNVFNPVIYAEIGCLSFFFGISQGVLAVYIPQLFPVAIRSTATGFCFNICRLFTGTAVLFIGILESFFGGYGNALFVFSLVFVLGLIVTFLSEEKSPQASLDNVAVVID